MQRFEAVTFDYGNLDEWRKYFEEIKELAKSCKVIEEFWNELKRRCNGLTFKDLQEEFDYSTVLLGGVTQEGEYKERSLARVYAELFGFKLENIHDLIEKLKRSLQPTTKVVVKETDFIRFVKNVSDKAMSILRQAESKRLINSADVDVEVDYFGILSDYKKLIEILENFVNNVAKILPNYNQKSLFVWTLDKLTYRYMTTVYPELREEKVFDLVKDVLGLEVIFSPDVEDEEVRRDYSIYSYHDGSIGRELIELFKMIWDAFEYDYWRNTNRVKLEIIFPEIPDYKKEYLKYAVQALKSINWKVPKFKRYQHFLSSEERRYKISGVVMPSYRYMTAKGYWSKGELECNESLIRILDELSPALFLLKGLMFDINFIRVTDGLYLETKIYSVSRDVYEYIKDFW